MASFLWSAFLFYCFKHSLELISVDRSIREYDSCHFRFRPGVNFVGVGAFRNQRARIFEAVSISDMCFALGCSSFRFCLGIRRIDAIHSCWAWCCWSCQLKWHCILCIKVIVSSLIFSASNLWFLLTLSLELLSVLLLDGSMFYHFLLLHNLGKRMSGRPSPLPWFVKVVNLLPRKLLISFLLN